MRFKCTATVKCYFFSYGNRSLYLFTQVRGKLNNLSLPYNNNVFLLLFYKNCTFTVTPFKQTLTKSFSVICVNRTITPDVVGRKPSQITELRSFFSLVFIVQVHSPVLIESFHSRQKSRSWDFWKRGPIWKPLTSDPTRGMGCLPRIIHLRGGGKKGDRVDSTRRGLHSIRRLSYSHKLLKL